MHKLKTLKNIHIFYEIFLFLLFVDLVVFVVWLSNLTNLSWLFYSEKTGMWNSLHLWTRWPPRSEQCLKWVLRGNCCSFPFSMASLQHLNPRWIASLISFFLPSLDKCFPFSTWLAERWPLNVHLFKLTDCSHLLPGEGRNPNRSKMASFKNTINSLSFS